MTEKPDEGYTDLEVRLHAWHEGHPVEAALEDGSRFEGKLMLDRAALANLEYDVAAYGRALFEALFAGALRSAYDRAVAWAQARTDGRLRLRLWVDDGAVELHALPWERLYHPWRGQMIPLATSAQTPFSRYTSLEAAEFSPVTQRPLRLLVALANPAGLPPGLKPVPVEAEVESLRQAVSAMCRQGQLQVTLLPGRSGLPPALGSQLRAEGWQVLEGATSTENLVRHLPGAHLFHFVGHGAFQRKSQQGEGQAALYLEKADSAPGEAGALQIVKDVDLVTRVAALGSLPHLFFLMACESATREAQAEHPFIGLGPRLVQAGVPAVVAMQAQVPMTLSQPFTGEFYRRLAEHGVVDVAMSQARLLVYQPGRTDWAVPVLFMRLREGRLFAPPILKSGATGSKEAGMPKTNGGIHIGGSVTVGGDMVAGDKIVTTTTVYGAESGRLAELLAEFQRIQKRVDALPANPDVDKGELKETLKKVEAEVQKGEQASGKKVENWLRFIAGMSDDIFQVVAATLANPVYGVATVIQSVARRAKDEKPGG